MVRIAPALNGQGPYIGKAFFGFDHGVGHLASIPTKKRKRRGSECHARTGQRTVCDKDHRYYVPLLTPQGILGGYLHTQRVTLSQADTTSSVSEYQRKEESKIMVLY